MIPQRRLGKTNVDVTIIGLGGEGVLRTHGREREAYELINRAIDLGINYFDSAKAYAGCESYHGKALGERRKDIFLAGKSHAHDRKGALAHLHDTLKTIKTDHLDLWQMHDMRSTADIDEVTARGGALEAFREAKEKGFDRFSTTLLQSTYQNHALIRETGEQIAKEIGIPFYYEDFRPGWRKGLEVSKSMGLYRQQYCGCIYSEKERYAKKG